MRVAIVTDTYTPQVNGVTTVVRRIVTLLGAQGHEAAVVAPRYPDHRDSTTGTELRIASVPFPPYPDIRLSLPSSRRVARFFDGFRPQLITTEVVTAGVALRVHHASDVLAGGALGLAPAVAAAYLRFLR